MRRIRLFLLLIVVVLLAQPVWSRGSGEADREESPSPAVEEPVESPDTDPADAAESDSGNQGDSNPDEPTPMDSATAEILFSIGMSPFENRIPSEDFLLSMLGGGENNLDSYRGKVVFLNFWATWCPPCREEMPSMQVLYDELADDGLEILAVNVLEDEATVSAFVEENGFTYPVMLDRQGRVAMRYAVRAYPTTYLLDRDGKVIAVRTGFHEWDSPEMIEAFRSILAQ